MLVYKVSRLRERMLKNSVFSTQSIKQHELYKAFSVKNPFWLFEPKQIKSEPRSPNRKHVAFRFCVN